MQEYAALGVFAVVYILVIGRRRFGVPIWAAMLMGAALMVGLRVIGVSDAFKAVNLEVIAFLFGMFSIVSALERSGALKMMAARMLARARTPAQLLMIFVVGMGVLAAFLVNDTIALLGIPLAVHVARHARIKPTVLLLALVFGITVGSAMTSIGNPQNLLIATDSGMQFPFVTFLMYLSLPTVANLFVTYLILKAYFRNELPKAMPGRTASAATREEEEERDIAGGAEKEGGGERYNSRQARLSIYVAAATLQGLSYQSSCRCSRWPT